MVVVVCICIGVVSLSTEREYAAPMNDTVGSMRNVTADRPYFKWRHIQNRILVHTEKCSDFNFKNVEEMYGKLFSLE